MTMALMFQGTGSGVGKSMITAGICRLLANKGFGVAPFKAQNMALNSGVTPDGLEMGRAQFLQAEAARIIPDIRMNPILIKPQAKGQSQLIRMGKVYGNYSARAYYELSEQNFNIVTEAYQALSRDYQIIVIEGAGSPAEINLQENDIVNMRMAAYANASVFIVADIDRGGVFAWMKGTYDLIPKVYRNLIKGFIINKFRGDLTLLETGIKMFQEYIPLPVVGTLPFIDIQLDEEDSQELVSNVVLNPKLEICVVRFPFISNFTDFLPFKYHREISLKYVINLSEIQSADVVILPGSKNTLADLEFLKASGIDKWIQNRPKHVLLIGICGGFQIMGQKIQDPSGIEGHVTFGIGLNIISMNTLLEKQKSLSNKTYEGKSILRGKKINGYEIHQGKSNIEDARFENLVSETNCCIYSADEKILGTYLHGIFENPEILEILFPQVEFKEKYSDIRSQELDQMASILEENLDMEQLIAGF